MDVWSRTAAAAARCTCSRSRSTATRSRAAFAKASARPRSLGEARHARREWPADGGLANDRIEALADGIFAVAMTLLVLDIKSPVKHYRHDGRLDRYLALEHSAIYLRRLASSWC